MKISKFMKQIFTRKYHSVFIAVLGQNQSGKTDFALRIFEYLFALHLADAFAANIPDLEAPFKIEFIEDFETLVKFCKMLNPKPNPHNIKRVFFLGDEMGNWAAQDRPWENTEFIKELQKVRKYGLSMIGTGITRIDKRILNEMFFHGYFVKSKTDQKRAVYKDYTTRTRTTINNIPRTTIKFDTFHPAMFSMKPKNPDTSNIPLNPEHELVKKYLEAGSWTKANIHPQEGKRALSKVLKFHMEHCLNSIHEEGPEKQDLTEEIESLI